MHTTTHSLNKARARLTQTIKARVEPTLRVMVSYRWIIKVREALWVSADFLPWAIKGTLTLGLFGSLAWCQKSVYDWIMLNNWDPIFISGTLGACAFALLSIFILGAVWVNAGVGRVKSWLFTYTRDLEFEAMFLDAQLGELPARHPFKQAFDRFAGQWLTPLEWRLLAYAQYDAQAHATHLAAVLPEATPTQYVRPRL